MLWEEEKEGFYKGHTKNYILAYLKVDNEIKKEGEEEKKKLENTIAKAKCIEAKKDHILVQL